MHDQHSHTYLHATAAGGSFWWLLEQLIAYGPSWSLVPPLLIGASGLLGALTSFLNQRQARRHREELHRRQLATAKFVPAVEGLDPRAN